jgi:hypothetical protein
MAVLLPLRASIARTFATRYRSWLIPERGSMPITIDIRLPAALACRLAVFIQYSDGAATVARKNHPSVFINGVTYA